MSFFNSSYRGCIWHHGIKGQKWGIRRTTEELGYKTGISDHSTNPENSVNIVDGVYCSSKGFTVAVAKLEKYCLNPEKKHSKEFYDVGYKPTDSKLLFNHIESGFDINKKTASKVFDNGVERFRIPMELGVTVKRLFTTAWQVDTKDALPKMTSAYRDRRNKGE